MYPAIYGACRANLLDGILLYSHALHAHIMSARMTYQDDLAGSRGQYENSDNGASPAQQKSSDSEDA